MKRILLKSINFNHKRAIHIACILSLVFFYGCGTNVNLVLSTKDNVNHNTTIELKNKNKSIKDEINAGLITAKSGKTVNIKMKKNDTFQVMSKLDNTEGLIYMSPEVSVQNITNPKNHEIELKSNFEYLDNAKSIEYLNTSLGNLKGILSANPIDFEKACDNIIGSLIVVARSPVTNNDTILHLVTPGKLGVRKMNLVDIKWNDSSEEGYIYISGSSANKISTTIPLMDKFGAQYDKDKIYQLTWNMKNFGLYLKPESKDRSPSELIMQLFFNDLEKIKIAIEENNARAFYINQAVVLKKANLEIKEGYVLDDSQNTIANVIFNNKAYAFNESSAKKLSYNNQILAFWGNEYTFNFAKQKVYTGKGRVTDYQIKYSIYNLNKSTELSPDLFKRYIHK